MTENESWTQTLADLARSGAQVYAATQTPTPAQRNAPAAAPTPPPGSTNWGKIAVIGGAALAVVVVLVLVFKK